MGRGEQEKEERRRRWREKRRRRDMYLVRKSVFVCLSESLTECRESKREKTVCKERAENKCGWCG